MQEDTIIAVSTPLGHGGLGVVRLSGPDALRIAKKIFKPRKKNKSILPKRPILGNINNLEDNEAFEEAYLIYFPGPQTYTREDVVEISCHGSPVILEEVVRLGVKAGARHSDPGEFTLRAYLHGRIDILQAEAINDLIHASSLKQARISFHQIEGGLSEKLRSLRSQIVETLSRIEARLEFPEENLNISPSNILKSLDKASRTVQKLIDSYNLGKTLSEGLSIAIAGRVNVGKSTLFNALLDRERSIVTPYPGTTRDYLQERIKIENSVFTLTDMAGLDKTSQPAEREGIKRGKRLALEADGILVLLDASQKVTEKDIKLIKKFDRKKTILLFNKIDRPIKMDIKKITADLSDYPYLEISALKGRNIDSLKKLMVQRFVPTPGKSDEVILHLRQKLVLEDIQSSLQRAKNLLKDGFSEEIYTEELRAIVPLIGELTGEIRSEEIIEEIFSRFCVGK